MSKREEKLQAILQDIQDSGFIKQVSTTMLEQAIMRQVGFSEATVKQYKRALEAHGFMKPSKNGLVWILKIDEVK